LSHRFRLACPGQHIPQLEPSIIAIERKDWAYQVETSLDVKASLLILQEFLHPAWGVCWEAFSARATLLFQFPLIDPCPAALT
jgi:hypothetical protein